MAYAVVNTDRMSGTEDSSQLLSVRFYDENDEVAAIENGAIVAYGTLLANEREIRKATAPDGTETIDALALVANPELKMNDWRQKYFPLDEYINEAGQAIRAFRFHQNDGFSVTKEAFVSTDTPAKGNSVYTKADSTKLTTTSGGTKIGVIDDVWTLGGYTYYYIVVAL